MNIEPEDHLRRQGRRVWDVLVILIVLIVLFGDQVLRFLSL
jgi:hypothetical protein